jgi:hypothetical protein
LALAGCAQGIAGQSEAPYAPYLPENKGNMPEHGSGHVAGKAMITYLAITPGATA